MSSTIIIPPSTSTSVAKWSSIFPSISISTSTSTSTSSSTFYWGVVTGCALASGVVCGWFIGRRYCQSKRVPHAPNEIPMSWAAYRTTDPHMRLENYFVKPKNHAKSYIPLAVGDPTAFGNFRAPTEAEEALIAAICGGNDNGYPDLFGDPSARQAIATRFTHPSAPITIDDILITNGCSHAIDTALNVLCDVGDEVLLPAPGFWIYETQSRHAGFIPRFYRLLPDTWEIDITHLESLITSRTRALVVNNPGNPTGANWTRSHLQAIVRVAERYNIPIISDEVYAYMVFPPTPFTPISHVSCHVPILTIGGIAKQYAVPGWRLGWIILHDPDKRCEQIRTAFARHASVILGTTSLLESILPTLLLHTPDSYYAQYNQQLEAQATYLYQRLIQIQQIKAHPSQGGIFFLVEILFDQLTDITNDIEFVQHLVTEENLFVLAGTSVNAPGYVRLTFIAPIPILADACDRIQAFCERHAKQIKN